MITLLKNPLQALQATQAPIGYQVIDNHTRQVVGTCKTRAGAYRSADKRDNAYGAVRFSVISIYA